MFQAFRILSLAVSLVGVAAIVLWTWFPAVLVFDLTPLAQRAWMSPTRAVDDGQALLKEKKPAEAREELEGFIDFVDTYMGVDVRDRLDRPYRMAHVLLIQAHEASGDLDLAIEVGRRLVAFAPRDLTNQLELARVLCLTKEHREEGLEMLQVVQDFAPSWPRVVVRRVSVLVNIGRFEEAMQSTLEYLDASRWLVSRDWIAHWRVDGASKKRARQRADFVWQPDGERAHFTVQIRRTRGTLNEVRLQAPTWGMLRVSDWTLEIAGKGFRVGTQSNSELGKDTTFVRRADDTLIANGAQKTMLHWVLPEPVSLEAGATLVFRARLEPIAPRPLAKASANPKAAERLAKALQSFSAEDRKRLKAAQ